MFYTVNESLIFSTVDESLMLNTVNDNDFGAKISEPMHSEYDISSSSGCLKNSFENIDSISMSIMGSDITAGIDSGISLETCALVRNCVDAREGNANTTTDQKFENATQVKFHLSLDIDRDVSTPTKKLLDNPELVKDRSSFGTTLERSIPTLSSISTPLTDFSADENSISTDSLPLMNRIPEISNFTTPELSLISDNSITSSQEIHNILQNVGYAPAVIEKVLPHSKQAEDKPYSRDRPLTQVFWQGKTFTYDKLEIADGVKTPKRQVISSKDEQTEKAEILNLSSDPSIPRGADTNAITSPINNELNRDVITSLQNIRIDNLKNVIIGQLNINSLKTNFIL